MKPIYLDFNASTPVDAKVRQVMLPFLTEEFGNPSSTHPYGVKAKAAVEEARRQTAALLRCEPDEIIFTGGGTESNNLAIKGVVFAAGRKGHIITSRIEHPSVLEVCEYLEHQGYEVTYVGVDPYGMVDPEEVEQAIRPDTLLITIMHANNEVGTLQPLPEITRIARKHGIPFHTDAAQSVGKIPVHVDELGVDLLSLAGQKMYAPKGVGALYVRRGTALAKQMHGAGHERNLRAGTENVPGIVGLGQACEQSLDIESRRAYLKARADQFFSAVGSALPNVRLNGHPTQRLPNTLSLSFYGSDANAVLSELKDLVAASAGAACHAGGVEVSHVLTAMGVPHEWARGTIRFSVGLPTTPAEIDAAAEQVIRVVKRLQGQGGPVSGAVKLTHFTHGLGCACKLRPQVLERVLAALPRPANNSVLVGAETMDDAAVYRLDEQTAVVQTVDFFTPIVDDPYQFGAVAAANALSDIYAMGGKPLFALNIVAFPSDRLPASVLNDILRGAADKAAEAGVVILGGHTVDDSEPKYGMAVTGIISPSRIWRNVGARPGDALVLTKPLGTGVLSTALKRGMVDSAAAAIVAETMSELNRTAAETAAPYAIHACTDITGFGLLGHLWEMIHASGVAAVIESSSVPLLPQAVELTAAGAVPGGSKANLEYISPHVGFASAVSPYLRLLLADAQTSGGLLFAVAESEAERLLNELHDRGVKAARIGMVVEHQKLEIEVR